MLREAILGTVASPGAEGQIAAIVFEQDCLIAKLRGHATFLEQLHRYIANDNAYARMRLQLRRR